MACNAGMETALVAGEGATSTTREVPFAEGGHLTGVDGERINVTGGCGTGHRAEEERGYDTCPSHGHTIPVHFPAHGDPDNTAFASSGGAGNGTSEAPQGVNDPRRYHPADAHQGRDGRCGGGDAIVVASSGGSFLLDGIAAKVKTRHSPRRKLPAYLSASPNGFGAASRWGALSKAHLEFHRLGTAGE